jgi:hypothetical protein
MRFLVLACFFASSVVFAGAAVPLTPAGNGHLLVPAMVDGAGPFPAVLDTGADVSGVYQWFAEQLLLRPVGRTWDSVQWQPIQPASRT